MNQTAVTALRYLRAEWPDDPRAEPVETQVRSTGGRIMPCFGVVQRGIPVRDERDPNCRDCLLRPACTLVAP